MQFFWFMRYFQTPKLSRLFLLFVFSGICFGDEVSLTETVSIPDSKKGRLKESDLVELFHNRAVRKQQEGRADDNSLTHLKSFTPGKQVSFDVTDKKVKKKERPEDPNSKTVEVTIHSSVKVEKKDAEAIYKLQMQFLNTPLGVVKSMDARVTFDVREKEVEIKLDGNVNGNWVPVTGRDEAARQAAAGEAIHAIAGAIGQELQQRP